MGKQRFQDLASEGESLTTFLNEKAVKLAFAL